MKALKKCYFDIDINLVELLYTDGCRISIDVLAVEDAVNTSLKQRSELDWLLYNKAWEYADLVLNGGLEAYLSYPGAHQLDD